MLGSWGGSPYNTASVQPMRDFDGLWALAAFRFNFVMQNFVQTFDMQFYGGKKQHKNTTCCWG